jgi:hypothetical protein
MRVVIAGAGLAGTWLALALGQRGYQVAESIGLLCDEAVSLLVLCVLRQRLCSHILLMHALTLSHSLCLTHSLTLSLVRSHFAPTRWFSR